MEKKERLKELLERLRRCKVHSDFCGKGCQGCMLEIGRSEMVRACEELWEMVDQWDMR